MRIFVSGLRKLVRRPATWVTGGLLMGLLVLIVLAVGATANNTGGPRGREIAAHAFLTFPGAYDEILSFIFGFGGLLAVLYAAAIAGSEWTWGTLKSAIARGESRWLYMLASYAGIAVAIAVGLAITFVIGIAAAVAAAHMAGISTSGLSDSATLGRLPQEAVRGWFGILEEGALGFAIATLARSQLAGIGIGLAFYFGETFSMIFLPDIVKYLPFAVARSAVGASGGNGPFGGGSGFASLPENQALLLVAIWLVGSLAVVSLFTDRAEITG